MSIQTFNRAFKAGVKIAFGTDAGGFDWKINPAMADVQELQRVNFVMKGGTVYVRP